MLRVRALLCSQKSTNFTSYSKSKLLVVYKHHKVCPPQLLILLTIRSFLLLFSLLFTILQPHWPPCCFPDVLGTPPPLGLCTFHFFWQICFPVDGHRLIIQLSFQRTAYTKFQPLSYSLILILPCFISP